MPTNSKRPALIGAAALAAACAVVAGGLATRHSQAEQLKQSALDHMIPTVSLVEQKDVPGAPLDLPARIDAWSRAPIYARVSGYLEKWNVDIGARVKAGQVLAVIDTPDLDQDLAAAKANLAVARSNLTLAESTAKRWESLVGQNAVSKQDADTKQGDYLSKRATVQALQASVDREEALKRYTRLTAPFDGVVTERNTDVGALVNVGGGAGSELFVVSDLHRLRVYVNVPQRQVALIKPGSVAKVTVPEHPDKTYEAKVTAQSQAISAGSGAMQVQLAVDNSSGDLLPGAFANVRFDLPADPGAVTVPPGALIVGKNGVQVATVDANNRAHIRKVSIARDLGSVVQLAGGVSRGERIIDSPPDGLAEGDQVRVAQAAPPVRKAG
jgi:RND family efflux transporter MFP subunit